MKTCVILAAEFVSAVRVRHVVFLSAARGVENSKRAVMLCTGPALLTYNSDSVWQESAGHQKETAQKPWMQRILMKRQVKKWRVFLSVLYLNIATICSVTYSKGLQQINIHIMT